MQALDFFGSAEKVITFYYQEYIAFAKEMPFDIIGHIDIYTKLNEKYHIFDDTDPEHRSFVLDCIDEIARTGKIFEVNTGAMSRGYRTSPYPAEFILRRLLELKAPIILSSDAHSAGTICNAFSETEQMLRNIGFRTQMKITDKGFVEVPL